MANLYRYTDEERGCLVLEKSVTHVAAKIITRPSCASVVRHRHAGV